MLRLKTEYKIDTNKCPRVPYEIGAQELSNMSLEYLKPGWYPIIVAPNGLYYLSPYAGRFEDLSDCTDACIAHNKWMGMRKKDILSLLLENMGGL